MKSADSHPARAGALTLSRKRAGEGPIGTAGTVVSPTGTRKRAGQGPQEAQPVSFQKERARGKARAPIAILSDFGYRDHYVGAMKGVIASIAPGAPIIDITHGVPPQSVTAGAFILRASWRYFPRGTIFLAVVDPGVGTPRLPVVVETRAGARFVGPDNGLLWPAVAEAGFARAFELRSPRYRLERISATFHGRDIFAPGAAWLWRGVRPSAMGPALASMRRLDIAAPVRKGRELCGSVVYADHFGNLVTNINRASFERFASFFHGKMVSVRISRSARIQLRKAYGDAPKGAPLAIFGSFELLEIAVRDGSAAERFGAQEGTSVTVVTG
jgi:S-adenosyl-L-methionine hydrolase (adenosine-forming)